jgi:hypothetical protein
VDGTPGCFPDTLKTKTYQQDTSSGRQKTPADLGSELILVLAVLALLYRLKA